MMTEKTNESPILETKDLTKRFGALVAVGRINLRVGAGVHAVIGPNGAGKTTLFNLLSGFLVPDRGEVYYRGKKITGLPPHRISQMGIGRSFQITSIFPALSVRENIRIAAQSRSSSRYNFLMSCDGLVGVKTTTDTILTQVGLDPWADTTAKNLPYGLQRCLDIGISLATNPDLIMLDEPTSGMGSEDTERVLALIGQISQRLPVVLIEHNIDVVLTISDKITVLYQGLLLAEGTPSEIREHEGVQEAYLGGY
ncbi:MAG: ABC transporter ATP-binding protein [Desulfomonilaceae bacterium]|nr:ABC transporter ATP-binding protein [Desulfomonilaceae bacterium]